MTVNIHPEYELLVHDMSSQMAASTLARRSSKSSGSHTTHRSSRIEKPRSNHNSPRTVERRKTTCGVKRYATLDDHFEMMFGSSVQQQVPVQNPPELQRPVSWHPSSSQFQVPPSFSGGSDYYSLSPQSPAAQPFPSFTESHESNRGSDISDGSWQYPYRHSYALSSYSTPSTESWSQPGWTLQTQNGSANDGSSDFLPIQRPATQQYPESTVEDENEDSGNELVGMGLYDPPEPSLGWDSIGSKEGTGKGLKLEETWQPPETEEDEDADDTSSDDGSVEELPAKEVPQQLPVQTKPQLPTSMDGQSFFFDDEGTYTKEWWFQQLKQPTVQATGLGYGWI